MGKVTAMTQAQVAPLVAGHRVIRTVEAQARRAVMMTATTQEVVPQVPPLPGQLQLRHAVEYLTAPRTIVPQIGKRRGMKSRFRLSPNPLSDTKHGPTM